MKYGVEEAFDLGDRGGYEKTVSMGVTDLIRFELYYKELNERPITYELEIELDDNIRPVVKSECLRQRRKSASRGWPFSFMNLSYSKGEVWKGQSLGTESSEKVNVELTDARHLGIVTLGVLKEHPRISSFLS